LLEARIPLALQLSCWGALLEGFSFMCSYRTHEAVPGSIGDLPHPPLICYCEMPTTRRGSTGGTKRKTPSVAQAAALELDVERADLAERRLQSIENEKAEWKALWADESWRMATEPDGDRAEIVLQEGEHAKDESCTPVEVNVSDLAFMMAGCVFELPHPLF